MFRVVASHEAAVALRNALAAHTDGRIWTNRYPHSDHFHIELDQLAAAQLVQALTTTTTREGNITVKTPSTAQDETEATTTNEEQLTLLAAVVDGLRRLK